MIKMNNVSVITLDGVKEKSIWIEDNLIKEISDKPYEDGLSFGGLTYLMPGLIDLYVGGFQHNAFNQANIQVCEQIVENIQQTGVTSMLALVDTQGELDKKMLAIDYYQKRKSELAANILGLHLDGPYLNDDVTPSIAGFRTYEDMTKTYIRMISLNLREQKSVDLIKYLKAKHIIPTLSTHFKSYGQFVEATSNGLSVSSYKTLQTPMSLNPLGSLGATLLYDEVFQTINDDLSSVSKEALELIYRSKGPFGLILTAMHDKGYQNMNLTIKNIMAWLNISLVEITWMASYNPARLLGVSKVKGSVEVGKDADLVLLNEDYEPIMVIIDGKITYQNQM